MFSNTRVTFQEVVSFLKSSFQDAFKGEREELEALTNVELVLELHPVEK